MTTRSLLIKELESVMKSDKKRWRDGAFERAIDSALVTLSYDRPLLSEAELTLIAGVKFYEVPGDCVGFYETEWGKAHVKQWDPNYPGVAPRVLISTCPVSLTSPRGLQLRFSKAPSAMMLMAHGACFSYLYHTLHRLTETECTVLDLDAELLFTDCLINLVKELIAAGVTEPVQMHQGMSDIPREATPVVALRTLKDEYNDLLSRGRDANRP